MDPAYERRLSLRPSKVSPPSSPRTPRFKCKTPQRQSSLGKRTSVPHFNSPPTIRRNLNLSPPELSPSKRPVSGDRFIPVRSRPILSSILALTENETRNASKLTSIPSNTSANRDPSPESHKEAVTYSCLLRNEILGSDITDLPVPSTPGADAKWGASPSRKHSSPSILHFRSTLSRSNSGYSLDSASLSPLTLSSQKLLLSPKRVTRKISKTPFKVLDAPELQDDYYLNLLDWSAGNMLAVGLGTSVYLWNAANSQVNKLHDFQGEGDCVTSVSWSESGASLCIGTRTGVVSIWDVSASARVASYVRHTERVGSLAWNCSSVCSGSRDKTICQWDTRSPSGSVPSRRLSFHSQEVCGLKWSADKQHLASGGNDNRLLVWNEHSPVPLHRFVEHRAAIKAIAWSPLQYGLLASGGGTQDKTIRFWNVTTGQQLSHIETGSQVAKLTGHANRVLYLSLSPDGQTIVTGAGDETLRFWNVFSKASTPKDICSPLEEAISNSSSFK